VILEITGKCSNKTRTGVHFKPESVFILDRNRCSDWAGIRILNGSNAFLTLTPPSSK